MMTIPLTTLNDIYRTPLSLLNDLYQLTMAQGYWASGLSDHEAIFQVYFRRNPFQSGFTVASGLQSIIDFVGSYSWQKDDIDYLKTLNGADGKKLFSQDFLVYLEKLKCNISLDGVEEGRVVFAYEPLVRVQGPLILCQLLETTLLNLINFSTLITTKAARICLAAEGDEVLEFGLRRAQGIDGGLTASRAAYLGGCSATSNLLAGKLFGIPVRGTHAHSWVMSFDDELTSFMAFAKAMPGNCVFLVDTYNTRDGIKHAIEAGKWLRTQGQNLWGIRLDSGDLAWWALEARKLLDEAGFKDTQIIASNDLDEHLITSLKHQHAPVGVWGVGTKLVTAYEEPALGGVYKLVAIRENKQAPWQDKVKLSEQLSKITVPGKQQVRRFFNGKEFVGDMIFDENMGHDLTKNPIMIDPLDYTRRKSMNGKGSFEDLLKPVFRDGQYVFNGDLSLQAGRARLQKDLSRLHEGIKRTAVPHQYPVGLEQRLHKKRADMILKLRGFSSDPYKGGSP